MNIEPITFKFQGRKLEVRAFLKADSVKASVVEGDKQVLPFNYSVSYETVADASMQKFSMNLIRGLMEIVRTDVQEGKVILIQV